jgi:flagellar hook assembly protein FlgD
VKDNLNIEQLFRDKFSSFEGEVSPSAWANIQQGLSTGTVVKTGLSAALKTALISGSIVAASVVGFYLFSSDDKQEKTQGPISNTIPVEPNQMVQTDLSNDEIAANTKNNVNNSVVNTNGTTNSSMNIRNYGSAVGNITPDGSFLAGGGEAQPGGSYPRTSATVNPQDKAVNNEDVQSTKENPLTASISVNEKGDLLYGFNVSGENIKSILWSYGDGLVGQGEEVTHKYRKPGKYIVEATILGTNGETIKQSTSIEIIAKSKLDVEANVITQNNDGQNDYFLMKNVNEIETFSIIITNKNGLPVWQSDDVNFKWFGTFESGENVEKGVYYYQYFGRGVDGVEYPGRGSITVK